jgi:hypothetical protein
LVNEKGTDLKWEQIRSGARWKIRTPVPGPLEKLRDWLMRTKAGTAAISLTRVELVVEGYRA